MLKTMIRGLLFLWAIFSLLLLLASFMPQSPILLYMVSAEANSDIYAYDVTFQLRANLSNNPYPEWRGAWSQTGLFAFTTTPSLHETDALYLMQDFGLPRRLESLRDSLIFGTSLSPDGRFLLYVTSEPANYSEIYRVDLADESQINFSNTPSLSESEPQWFGNQAVLFLRGGNLYQKAIDGMEILLIDTSIVIEKFSISPDMRTIAFHGLAEGERRLFLARNGAVQPVDSLRLSLNSEAPAWSPDSRALTLSLADGSLGIYQLATGHLSRFAGMANRINPVWSPDGRMIAFMENRRIHLLEWQSNHVFMLDESQQIRPPLLWMPYRKNPDESPENS